MAYDYRKFSFGYDDTIVGKIHIEYFGRTASGKGWKKAPYLVKSEEATGRNIELYIRSIPGFNNRMFPGDQSSCRAEWGYTLYRYMPVKVTTISPDGATKIIATFEFFK